MLLWDNFLNTTVKRLFRTFLKALYYVPLACSGIELNCKVICITAVHINGRSCSCVNEWDFFGIFFQKKNIYGRGRKNKFLNPERFEDWKFAWDILLGILLIKTSRSAQIAQEKNCPALICQWRTEKRTPVLKAVLTGYRHTVRVSGSEAEGSGRSTQNNRRYGSNTRNGR